MRSTEIVAPAGYVPQQAVAFRTEGGSATAVDAANPLPVRLMRGASTSALVSGATASDSIAGPFIPELDRPIWVTLSGSWTGSAIVLRSVDAGLTKLPLTLGGLPWGRFTGPAQEVIAEESETGASYWFDLAPTSGTITYRVSQ